MVRYLFLLFVVGTLLQASAIDKEVKSILGASSYAAKKGLISVLFKDKTSYYRGRHVDILKVLKTLRENKLLDLEFRQKNTFVLSFATTNKQALLFVKTIKDVLNSLGFNHTLTAKAVSDNSGFLWKVTLDAASVVNPYFVAKELRKRGAYLSSVKRYSKDNWRYNVEISHAKLSTKKLPINKKIALRKPLKPYWIDVEGARALVIDSKRGNIWHPYIVFYDEDLKILDNYTKERKSYNISLKIPRGTKYVKIGDVYTLENIKRGLTLYIQKR